MSGISELKAEQGCWIWLAIHRLMERAFVWEKFHSVEVGEKLMCSVVSLNIQALLLCPTKECCPHLSQCLGVGATLSWNCFSGWPIFHLVNKGRATGPKLISKLQSLHLLLVKTSVSLVIHIIASTAWRKESTRGRLAGNLTCESFLGYIMSQPHAKCISQKALNNWTYFENRWVWYAHFPHKLCVSPFSSSE